MFTYAQVDCQECWRKELQVRKAFGDNSNNKSSSKLRDVSLYMCGHMIKTALCAVIEGKGGLIVNLKHNHWLSKNFFTSPSGGQVLFVKVGKCILFSYSLHSAVKKKNITKLTRMSYFTPWSNFWRKNSLIRSALFLFQIFVKAMQLGCTLILITALVS